MSPATFVAHDAVTCAAPVSDARRNVALRARLRDAQAGAPAWSAASLPFTFYDSAQPPRVTAISRIYGPLDAGDDSTVT